MIVCPNCGKEVDEGAAHCGHCGEKIETEQKKTMIGLGAVDMDDIKKKVEESKNASQNTGSDATGGEAAGVGVAEPPGLDSDVGDDEEDEASTAKTEVMSEISLPTPGEARAESESGEGADAEGDVEGEAGEEDTESRQEFATASTEAMDSVDAPAVGEEDPGTADTIPESDSGPQAPQVPQEELMSPGAEGTEPGFGEPMDPPESAQEPEPGSGAGPSAQLEGRFGDEGGPTEMGAGMETEERDVSDSSGSNKKSRRRLLIGLAVIFFAIFGCCIGSAALFMVMGPDMEDGEFSIEVEEEYEFEQDFTIDDE